MKHNIKTTAAKTSVELTERERVLVLVALALRREACLENGETQQADEWQQLRLKFRKLVCLVLMVLASVGCNACGPSYTCPTPWGYFDSELPFTCEAITKKFALAEQLMTTDQGLAWPWSPGALYRFVDADYPQHALMTRIEFEAMYKDQVVHVSGDDLILCGLGNASGCYSPFDGSITLNQGRLSLLHELFHAKDRGMNGHDHWQELGYYSVSNAYAYFAWWGWEGAWPEDQAVSHP